MAELSLDGEPLFVDVSGLTELMSGADEKKFDQEKLQEDQGQSEVQKPNKKANDTNNLPKLRCTECKRFTCDSEEKMVRHMRHHRGENPFQCYMCDYSTYNKAVFEEHIRIHKGIKPYKCSHCNYRSASKKNTKKHEQIHSVDNPRRCKQCDFIARHVRALESHMATEHGEKPSKKIECSVCFVTFNNRVAYQKHRKNHRKCKDCDFVTTTTALLKKHIEENHGVKEKEKVSKSKEDLFHCSLCAYSSSNKVKILLHLIHHPDQDVDENVINVSILREHGIMK